MIIAITQMLELNNILKPFDLKIHIHDTCGGQTFSISGEMNSQVKTLITDWFSAKKCDIEFSSDDKNFWIK